LTFSLASASTYFTASLAFFSALDTVEIAAFVLATYFYTAVSIFICLIAALSAFFLLRTTGDTISSSLSLSESASYPVVLATTFLTILALNFVSASTLAALAAVLAAALAEGEILSSSESCPVTLVVESSSSESLLSGAFLCLLKYLSFILIKALKSVTLSRSVTIPSITGSRPYSIPNFFSNLVIYGTLAAIDLIQLVIFLVFYPAESELVEILAAYLAAAASYRTLSLSFESVFLRLITFSLAAALSASASSLSDSSASLISSIACLYVESKVANKEAVALVLTYTMDYYD